MYEKPFNTKAKKKKAPFPLSKKRGFLWLITLKEQPLNQEKILIERIRRCLCGKFFKR